MIHPRHENNLKALVSLFIVLLAFGIFLLFTSYKDSIIANGQLGYFISLSVIEGALLIGLLFLTSNSKVQKNGKVNAPKANRKPVKKLKKKKR